MTLEKLNKELARIAAGEYQGDLSNLNEKLTLDGRFSLEQLVAIATAWQAAREESV